MPLQRRLPKFGFVSRKSLVGEEIRITDLERVSERVVTLATLRRFGLVSKRAKYVKIFGRGEVTRAFTVRGLAVSKGARASIEGRGGRIEE